MDLSQAPSDINYNIALNSCYKTLNNLCVTSQIFNRICASNIFWERKAMHDFNLTAEQYNELAREVIGKESYIKVAAIHGVPILGAIKYGNSAKLVKNLIKEPVIEASIIYELAETITDPRILDELFTELGTRGMEKVIFGTIYRYGYIKNMVLPAAAYGAARAGLLPLTQLLVNKSAYHDSTEYLNAAVRSGNIELVDWLLQSCGNSNYLKEAIGDSLYHAIEGGYQHMILHILSFGPFAIYHLDSALQAAASTNNQQVFDILVAMGAEDFYTALAAAAATGKGQMVFYILNHPQAGLRYRFKYQDLFWYVGKSGNMILLTSLLQSNITDYISVDIALSAAVVGAASAGHLATIKNIQSIDKYTLQAALNIAAKNQHMNVVNYLVSIGGDVNSEIVSLLASFANLWQFKKYYAMLLDPATAAFLTEAINWGNLPIVEYLYGITGTVSTGDVDLILNNPNMRYYFK